jgi:myo-inositol-1-phosphate synthase
MREETFRPSTATGPLGVMIVGMGAVSTTLIAGVTAVRHGLGRPFGSLTQMGRIPATGNGASRPFGQCVPLASLQDLVFGGWDILPDDAYTAAVKARVLDGDLLGRLRPELEAIRPWPGVFDSRYVKRLQPTHSRRHEHLLARVEELQNDMRAFQEERGTKRAVLLYTASTEAHHRIDDVHRDLDAFERGLREDDERISPGMLYGYAALMSGVPVINCTPNHVADVPALIDLARERRLPVAGRDLKTGQTLMKTILAPALKIRALGLEGWYSTNILGNRDGEVLDDPDCLRSKQESKLAVLNGILQPELQPELYGDFAHRVRIDYYPPRRDNKEAWDNIDIFGWLNYPMQIKINFLCRDSILAAPLALDLVLLGDLAHRAKLGGVMEWLSLYFKSPMVGKGEPVHDLFAQYSMLEETVEWMGALPERKRDRAAARHTRPWKNARVSLAAED